MKEEWKVYIKGVQGRGKEVIKVLTELGGKKGEYFSGNGNHYVYFITHTGEINNESIYTEKALIIMDNYRELKLPEQWKDGDILIANNGTCYKIFLEYDSDNDTAFYVYNMSMQIDGTLTKYTGSIWHGEKIRCFRKDFRLATPSEVERFHELLHKHGKDWDTEKKQLVDWRWKPKNGETYWVVYGNGRITSLKWEDFSIGNDYLDFGNCFKTKEEAFIMSKKIRDLLKEK